MTHLISGFDLIKYQAHVQPRLRWGLQWVVLLSVIKRAQASLTEVLVELWCSFVRKQRGSHTRLLLLRGKYISIYVQWKLKQPTGFVKPYSETNQEETTCATNFVKDLLGKAHPSSSSIMTGSWLFDLLDSAHINRCRQGLLSLHTAQSPLIQLTEYHTSNAVCMNASYPGTLWLNATTHKVQVQVDQILVPCIFAAESHLVCLYDTLHQLLQTARRPWWLWWVVFTSWNRYIPRRGHNLNNYCDSHQSLRILRMNN